MKVYGLAVVSYHWERQLELQPVTAQPQRAMKPTQPLVAIRALVADDHPAIIDGLSAALRGQGISVVARATTVGEIAAAYASSLPDVVVLDIRFGALASGLDAASELLKTHPTARIVFYSQYDQDEMIREAYRVGGSAFITKNTPSAGLAEAIKEVHQGKIHFLPEISARLALMSVRGDESPVARLEPRELQVFVLMAQSRTNLEIAETMNLSPKTISITSQKIKDKLSLYRAAELTSLALKYGLIGL